MYIKDIDFYFKSDLKETQCNGDRENLFNRKKPDLPPRKEMKNQTFASSFSWS